VQARQAYFGTHGDDDAQLGRHNVQPLRAVFADLVHDTAATGADQAGGLDDLFYAWKPRGQIADGALWGRLGCPIARLGGPRFLFCINFGQRIGQVLECQLPFISRQLFRAPAMQGVAQLCEGDTATK
jgi:hypothetical protein